VAPNKLLAKLIEPAFTPRRRPRRNFTTRAAHRGAVSIDPRPSRRASRPVSRKTIFACSHFLRKKSADARAQAREAPRGTTEAVGAATAADEAKTRPCKQPARVCFRDAWMYYIKQN